ncbi:hypothetical protein [Streptomyces sp. SKN60]|uniref:hypothetical protein n=1 Tax=Streptomyces sp. SKN60 TaxID=2855506 RepID=UPI0022451492|nr:hypothetical protein [Streptomyces sp. SKN60]
MSEARWGYPQAKLWGRVAAAAGVVLLVAGCGSNGGSDKGSSGGSSSAGAASAGATGGSGAGGGEELSADDVKQEIETAATGAGLQQDAKADQVPAGTEQCMVMWNADGKKAADPKRSYDETVAALGKEGWQTGQSIDQAGTTIKSLNKGTWMLKAHNMGALKLVMFIATDAKPACAEALKVAGPPKTS